MSNVDGLIFALVLVVSVVIFANSSWLQARADKEALETDKEALETDKETLQTEKEALEDQIAKNRLVPLKEYDDIEKQKRELAEQVEKGKLDIDRLQKDVERRDKDISDLAQQNEESEEQIDSLREKEQQYKSDLDRKAAEIDSLTKKRDSLAKERDDWKQKAEDLEEFHRTYVEKRLTVHRELVGLNGKLHNVAVLFDVSGSMAEKIGEQSRWDEARSVVETWLEHLAVNQCVLILFGTDVRTVPSDGTLRPIKTEEDRDELIAGLTGVVPSGRTNTFEAMERAYKYDIDTIILFTDGAPNKPSGGQGGSDPEEVKRIYRLCEQQAQREIPVNTVGLGNYFDAELSAFLRKLAADTGGTYRGR